MKQDVRQIPKTKHTRSQIAGRWLLGWTLFIGLGAVAGASGMLLDPSGKALGMDAMLPYFQVMPLAEYLYQDFLFPGIALLIVNGLTNLTAAVLLLLKKKSGVILGGVFGITLMLWICIQFVIFPLNFMSTIYFVFGFCQAVTGYMTWVFAKQEAFRVAMVDYPNIGTNSSRLVVFFSRMGYVKKQAYEAANRTGAEVYEIKATERTEGTLGFWWCGRFAMHRWAMPIEPVAVNLTAYDHVTICTPIWVFSLASPVREFCRQAAGKIKAADYVLVHHTRGHYASVAAEMDGLLGITHRSCVNVCCRKGVFSSCK
ncbi:MAG: hypothetical protein ACI3W7_06335 [Oscillospiraceae bacterium]